VYPARLEVRDDLARAHARVWQHVTGPGGWWSADERRAIAELVLTAFHDPQPLPPWLAASMRIESDVLAPVVVDAAYRMTSHAHTLTAEWYASVIERRVSELAYVELCGIVMAVSAVASFARSIGAELPPLPPARPGDLRWLALDLARSPRNWVPVAAPGGVHAPVVEALSAAPGEHALLWEHLAPTQYMADEQMVDLAWTRGTLSRPQAELVAARVALLRECFF
jgi:hypothetical protein